MRFPPVRMEAFIASSARRRTASLLSPNTASVVPRLRVSGIRLPLTDRLAEETVAAVVPQRAGRWRGPYWEQKCEGRHVETGDPVRPADRRNEELPGRVENLVARLQPIAVAKALVVVDANEDHGEWIAAAPIPPGDGPRPGKTCSARRVPPSRYSAPVLWRIQGGRRTDRSPSTTSSESLPGALE